MALSAPSFASRDDAATSTGRRDLRPLRYLLRYVGRYRQQLALAAVALVVAAGTVLGLGQGLRLLVDRGFGGRDPALLDAALVVLLTVVLLLALASFLRFYMSRLFQLARTGSRITFGNLNKTRYKRTETEKDAAV